MIFKNKLQETVSTLESTNVNLQAKIDEMTIELNSFTDQSELIASLQTEVSEQAETITGLTEKVELAEQEEVDVSLEVSKQTAENIADLGLEPVEVLEDEDKSIMEQYANLTGDKRKEFFAENKTEILKSAKLNLYTK